MKQEGADTSIEGRICPAGRMSVTPSVGRYMRDFYVYPSQTGRYQNGQNLKWVASP
jgi:hypothetical protein